MHLLHLASCICGMDKVPNVCPAYQAPKRSATGLSVKSKDKSGAALAVAEALCSQLQYKAEPYKVCSKAGG